MKIHSTLLYALAAGLFCFAVSACRTADEFRAAAYSAEIQYGTYMDGELSNSKRDFDVEGQWIAIGIRPFAWQAAKMQADMNARAILEQRYAERPPPPEPQPCAEKPK